MTGPAEVQILRVSESFTATLVPVTRMACRPRGITEVLPVMQARAYTVAHNKEFHPYVTVLNPDYVPLSKYEVID